ncbi:hypothetical protein HII31_01997 [Pseudocercospora fuligena]|uniref:Uncharacterized protein n=1 Tax=Pseudocercospora fuligena TaxID=685502 RepID=A0A8H6RTL0_9PEZI|nr:hypothetical protein HII31_01997 [Pseudocercospora fuligena]
MSRKCTRSLSDLVQSLPQELYDMIYDATFTAAPETLIVRDSSCAQIISSLMHVDRRSRLIYAEQFYGNTIIATSTDIAEDLFAAVAQQHKTFLKKIYVIMPGSEQYVGPTGALVRAAKKSVLRIHWGACYGYDLLHKTKIIDKIEDAK